MTRSMSETDRQITKTNLETLIELKNLKNRKSRLDDKLKEHEYPSTIEELSYLIQ